MRIVFAGTSDFAVPALDALARAGHEIAAVCTQPGRPAGRGRKLRATPVARHAAAHHINVRTPERLDAEVLAELRDLAPDALVVVAYGLILPPAALEIPRHGGLNLHASLLPRWRGAAPIARAILAGDTETGVTIMRMDAGLDTGAILLQERTPIRPDDTAGSLQERLAAAGARLMVQALEGLVAGTSRATPQPADGVTYAKKIAVQEARLVWTRPAEELARAVRAFNPAPVAWSLLDGERVRIHRARARAAAGGAAPGTICSSDDDAIVVATGNGELAIEQLQRAGGKVLRAAEARRGWRLAGRRFG